MIEFCWAKVAVNDSCCSYWNTRITNRVKTFQKPFAACCLPALYIFESCPEGMKHTHPTHRNGLRAGKWKNIGKVNVQMMVSHPPFIPAVHSKAEILAWFTLGKTFALFVHIELLLELHVSVLYFNNISFPRPDTYEVSYKNLQTMNSHARENFWFRDNLSEGTTGQTVLQAASKKNWLVQWHAAKNISYWVCHFLFSASQSAW